MPHHAQRDSATHFRNGRERNIYREGAGSHAKKKRALSLSCQHQTTGVCVWSSQQSESSSTEPKGIESGAGSLSRGSRISGVMSEAFVHLGSLSAPSISSVFFLFSAQSFFDLLSGSHSLSVYEIDEKSPFAFLFWIDFDSDYEIGT
jgi:hypothetical protein